jgi:hypothetical protein
MGLSRCSIGMRLAECLQDPASGDDIVEPAREGLAGVAGPERQVRPDISASSFRAARTKVLPRSRFTSYPARESSTHAAALASHIAATSSWATARSCQLQLYAQDASRWAHH